jgi:uncharacterized OsmC-like protein
MTESAPQPTPADRGPHFEVEVVQVRGHIKEGRITQNGKEFVVMSDEGPRLGGENTAPTPLAYFTLGIGF